MQKRMDYLDYVAAAPRPSVVVIEDKDEPAGYGAFWGEVQTNVHKALGCLGVVTNGSIRDIPAVAEGFQMLAGSISPSHAYVHVLDFGVSVTSTAWRSKAATSFTPIATAPSSCRSRRSTRWRRHSMA